MEYLVLMAVALDHKTFYPSRLLPAWEMACPDPLEALLQATDDHGIKVFVGNGFWGQWDSPGIIADERARASARRNGRVGFPIRPPRQLLRLVLG